VVQADTIDQGLLFSVQFDENGLQAYGIKF